mmetsp:Transcript_31481/g.72380  ORF Transcript_31481/g.72380 Transcript_31481/m.72380 type:complete len:360 (+) Transcript_31481:1161-2240(+)
MSVAFTEPWPLSLGATVSFVRRVLDLMAGFGIPLERTGGSPPSVHPEGSPAIDTFELVRLLSPPIPLEEVLGWWRAELFLLALPPFKPPPKHKLKGKAQVHVPYLTLDLPASNIISVDSLETIEAMATELRKGKAVGIDSEWRPTGFLVQTRCALLQLANETTVFLVDLHSLLTRGDEISAEALDRALILVFADAGIAKLVFGLKDDIRTLRSSFPQMRAFAPESLRSFVCVQERYERSMGKGAKGGQLQPLAPALEGEATAPLEGGGGELQAQPPATSVALERASTAPAARTDAEGGADTPSSAGSASLSSVCAALLGHQLDKTAQMSDWERRPLTSQQRHYAALDAHCLLALHAIIK